MYLLAPFIVQNLKKQKTWSRYKVIRMHHVGPKWPNCPKLIFFWKTINIISMSFFSPFIVQHCNTILTADPELGGCTILHLKWPICPKHDFIGKAINIISMYLSAPFIVQNFKKMLGVDPELWQCSIYRPKIAIFWPKMVHFHEQIFFCKNH